MRTKLEAFAALMKHIDVCPLGWHNGKIISLRSTDEQKVLIWLQQLLVLRAEAEPETATQGVEWSEEERRALGLDVRR